MRWSRAFIFFDYIACGKNYPEKIETIVKGISDGCVQGGLSLIGGETAEMPGFYGESEYDLAGFAVGLADKSKIIDGSKIREGDVIIGLASSGIHSNGYSLVRKVLRPQESNIKEFVETLGATMGDVLLRPTKIYVKPVLNLISQIEVKGIANITGGGFYENIPRMFPKGITAEIEKGTWPVLPVFEFIRKQGSIAERDMFGTFNMGIGMVLAVSQRYANEAVSILRESGEEAFIIGRAVKGDELTIC
ncbi:trifunctional purine biosynthetic protein adenosine-3-related [Holotrichia oblita]|nr:trifunctional purine biosynthetic protein adenosine-3-related [Holotrichia oblita]